MTATGKLLMSGLLAVALSAPTYAQTAKDGGISEAMLREIVSKQKQTAADKALFNAVAANSIDNLAKNHGAASRLNNYFSVETKAQSITDQKRSGRC